MIANKKYHPYEHVTKMWYKRNGKRYYMKSKWEYNYACYLDFLKDHNEIKDWTYEEDHFIFHKIQSGTRKYTPDFKLYNNDGSVEYREVKGWKDRKSVTKIKRMAKYYPEVKLIPVQQKEYKKIKQFKRIIKGWIE